LLVAIVAAIGLTATASANDVSGNPEPQTTNVPYTAWVGTEIRLAKCFDLFDRVDTVLTADQVAQVDSGQRVSLVSALYRGKFTIEAWSGANDSIVNSPFFVNGANGDRTADVVPFIEAIAAPAYRRTTRASRPRRSAPATRATASASRCTSRRTRPAWRS
jgi:hypothetical protein